MRCLIAFDMDGVLADVSRSYRAVVRETARRFFRPAPRWRELPASLFSLAELALLKQGGGLNNDWDLTYRVIELLMVPLGPVLPDRHRDPWERFRRTMGRLDLAPLLRFLARSREPLRDLARRPRPANPFLRGLCRGEVGGGNLVKQIFQEVYLGAARFRATYGLPPRAYRGKGFLERERLLAPPALLRSLASRHLLGIATGRPEAEAGYFLDRFALRPLFRPGAHPGGLPAGGAPRLPARRPARAPGKAAPFPAGRPGRPAQGAGRSAGTTWATCPTTCRRPGARAAAFGPRPGPGRPGPGSGQDQAAGGRGAVGGRRLPGAGRVFSLTTGRFATKIAAIRRKGGLHIHEAAEKT